MSSLKKNIAYNVIYRAIVIFIPLITSPYISRVLGATQLGVFTYTYSITYYFFLFSMLGVNNYGNREIAKARNDKALLSDTFWQIYYLQMFFSLIMSFIYLGSILIIKPEYFIISLIQLLHVLSAFTDINWFAFGMEEFKVTTIRSATLKIVTAIAFFIFVHSPEDLWKYTLILQAGNILSLIVIWPLVWKKVEFRKPNLKQMMQHFKPNLILFLPFVASSLYQYMDKIMLGSTIDKAEVGFYNYAENIISIPLQLTVAVGTVMLPHVSSLIASDNKDRTVELLNAFLKYVTWINVALAFGVAAVSDVFVPWFLGAEYQRTALLLMLLSPMVVINGVADIIRTQYLIPNARDKIYTISICFGAGLNLLMNFLLIPRMQGVGASLATITAYLSQLIIQMFATRKELNYGNFFRVLSPYVLAGVGMFFVVRALSDAPINSPLLLLILMAMVGMIVYLTSTIVWMLYVENDTQISKVFSGFLKRSRRR